MRLQFLHRRLTGRRGWWLVAAAVVVVGLAIGAPWIPRTRELAGWAPDYAGESSAGSHDAHEDESDHDHAGEADHEPGAAEDGHDHAQDASRSAVAENEHEHAEAADHAHDEASAVRLSPTAQQNVGLRLAKIELGSYERTITVPAMVVEQPGRSEIQVAAPLTGVVTRIWPLRGETVAPGQPLFDLRLTHEEVVEAQSEFLRTAEELDVLGREIDRLTKISAEGAIAAKTLLERKYEQQKLQAVFRAQRQRLLLHGLSAVQVDEIIAKRSLLDGLTVFAPKSSGEVAGPEGATILQVEELRVTQGQHVKAGDPLCVLGDHSRLYVEGRAFEQDGPVLDRAVANNWPVSAIVEGDGRERQTIRGLVVVYLANRIEPESRAFPFYVELPNQLTRDHRTPEGRRFSSWRFKPGQRVQLLVPAERWPDRIVLPPTAVVEEGGEAYVFEQNSGHFDRRSVRVEYRDRVSVVIANDGALTPGRMVIVSGSYQVHLAMKNKLGGVPDPHAGHNH